jgi:hypothetical protein
MFASAVGAMFTINAEIGLSIVPRNNNIKYRQFLENWARWQQLFLAIVMIIFFPVSLCVLIAAYLCGIVITAIIGFFCGPCVANQSFNC